VSDRERREPTVPREDPLIRDVHPGERDIEERDPEQRGARGDVEYPGDQRSREPPGHEQHDRHHPEEKTNGALDRPRVVGMLGHQFRRGTRDPCGDEHLDPRHGRHDDAVHPEIGRA